jgi:hypothetical protein
MEKDKKADPPKHDTERDRKVEAIKVVLSEANVRAEALDATAVKIAGIIWGS